MHFNGNCEQEELEQLYSEEAKRAASSRFIQSPIRETTVQNVRRKQ